MKAQDYLNRIAFYDSMMGTSLDRIIEIKQRAMSITAPMDKERVQSSGSGDMIADNVAKYVDIEMATIRDWQKKKRVIVRQILDMKDASDSDFLYKRYVQYMSYEQISNCDKKNRTVRQLYRVHNDALLHFQSQYLKQSRKLHKKG